jgi:cellobiose phosphorylase
LRTTVGLGYSQFELTCEGIVCTSRVMLAPDEPVEVWTFRVRNTTSRRRRLWLVPYIEWLLGGYATFSSPYSYLRSTFDPALRAVLRDEGLACEMEQRATAISAAIEQHGWDGRWYLAGYSDAGRPVGSAENREGRLYLNPQTWAVMTGLAQGVRRRACLRAIDGMLESRHGSLTLWPPYTKRDEHVGRVTMLLPGMYENGTPYCHGTAFKIVADLCAGRADHALASFLKVMPDHPDHPSTVSGCEPYAFTNQYLGPHHGRAGASISGWITGTAAWMFRAVWEYFPGIRPDYDGFLVRPCLPAAWSEVRAVRKIRGTSHAFRLVRTTSGVDVEVDGRKLAGDFVPYGC